MKKIISAAAALLIAASAFAQVHVGAGYQNMSNRSKYSDENSTYTMNFNGIYAGVGYDIALGANGLFLTPGAYFTVGSHTESTSEGSDSIKGAWREMYLNVPVRLSYGFEVAPTARLFAFAGPVISYGVSSKFRTTATVSGEKKSSDWDNVYNESYKRFDLKMGLGVGADIISRVRIKASYDIGLLNRSGESGEKLHSNVFSIGVAYLF